MKIIYTIVVLLLLPLTAIQSQKTTNDYDVYDDAEFFFSTEEYEEALYLFLQLYEKYPDNNNLNFRIGMSYLNIPGQERKSIKFFEKAVENTSLKYKARNFDEKKAPHHSWFYLGNAYRINNQMDEALDSYVSFMDIRKFEKNYNLRIVENEIKACERAKIIKDNPVNLVKLNLGSAINTGLKTYQPVVNRSETSLAFMQEQKFYNAIMYSTKENGEWMTPRNITPQVGSDGDMIPAAFSDDGKTMLLVKRSDSSNGDIYVSKKEGDFWGTAVKLDRTINSPRDESHASFSEDGNQLILVSSRRGGMGGLDIYISNKMDNGEWGVPINAGPNVNTEYDEGSAFLMNGGKSLFFTSKGHFNMGGFDIFFSEKNKDGEWSDPVNIGFPLNTTNDNPFYQPVKDGNSGYVGLFGEDENFGEEDIYRVEILPFTDPSVPANSKFGQDFIFQIENEETGEIIKVIYDRKSDSIKIESNTKKKFKWKLNKL